MQWLLAEWLSKLRHRKSSATFMADQIAGQRRGSANPQPDLWPAKWRTHCTDDGISRGEAIIAQSIDLEWVQAFRGVGGRALPTSSDAATE